jgi:protein CpxP
MKYRNLILATLLAGSLTTVGLVTISHAGPQCGDRHGMHGERMGYAGGHRDPLQRLMRQVDLTDAQQTEIKVIIDTSRTDMENVRQQLRDSRKAMYNLVAGTDYNLERVRELADQQAKLNTELTVARIDTMHRTLQVLTPDQQAELATLREQRMTKKKAWMEDHMND